MLRHTVLLFPSQWAYRSRYATALEYPVEVFTEEAELEANLCVDSVKQTELLSHAPTVTGCHRGQQIFDYATTRGLTGLRTSCSASSPPGHIIRHSSHPRFRFDQGAARPATSEIEEKS